MKLLVLQHVPFEGPAAIKAWADGHNHSIQHHCCTQSNSYPDPASFDCCIIMGGPMGVNDELPWMQPEIGFIKQCIAANKFILGICLGAQLVAKALGAEVTQHSCSEIGWFEVNRVEPSQTAGHWIDGVLPEKLTPLHWHSDRFSLPSGALHLYRSSACDNQAFIVRDKIIGLQFHLEFDLQTAVRVAEACASELDEACASELDKACTSELTETRASVQSAAEIIADTSRFDDANRLMHRLLDAMRLEFMRHNL